MTTLSPFLLSSTHNAAGRPGKPSEDLTGFAPSADGRPLAIWIFDGATSLSSKRLFPDWSSDPRWLVETMNEALEATWNDARPTVEILADAQRLLAEKLQQDSCVADPAPNETPCASMSLLRLMPGSSGTRLEVTNGGDCAVLMKQGNDVMRLGTSYKAAEILDAAIMRSVHEGKDRKQIGADVAQLNQELRDLVNEPGGFPLIDPTDRWVGKLHVNTYNLSPGDRLQFLLMTDGLDRAAKGLGLYTDKSLIEAVDLEPPQQIVARLRAAEEDHEASKPYLKIHDDAAFLRANVVTSAPG